MCRVGEHQHGWHIDVHYVKLFSHIHIRQGWGIHGLCGWGIYDLIGWGIYDSNRWGSYGKVSYCFGGDMLEKHWSSGCFLWRIFQPPITLQKTQSMVVTPEIPGYFSTMTQHFFRREITEWLRPQRGCQLFWIIRRMRS